MDEMRPLDAHSGVPKLVHANQWARTYVTRIGLVAAVVAALVAFLGVSAAAADPVPDPLTNPACFTTTGCGGSASASGLYNSAPFPNSGVGDMLTALPAVGLGFAEDPVFWTVPSLQSIALAGVLSYLSINIGTSIYHHWFQGHVTDTVTDSHCNNWGWKVQLGDPYGIGLQNATYLNAYCGISNTDTFAASPRNSFSTEGQWYSFWNYVINASGIKHGALYQIAATYCNGKSPCYTRAATLTDVIGATGPYSAAPSGTSASSGWADPATGKGLTTTAWPYNSGPSNPNPQCVQGGVTLPCSSVDPNGGTSTPAGGWPRHFGGDGYGSAEANTYRCALDPNEFACPAVDGGSDYASSGGPLVTMPDCYGMTVGGCESTIDGVLSAAGSTMTASFSTVVAPTYNPALPVGVVVATIAAATTLADASSVTMELNEETDSGNCQSWTDWPHPSSTQQSYGMMLVKGRVKCSTAQTASGNVILWKCTSEPDPSTADLQSALDLGTWGCAELKNAPYSVTVAANTWSPDLVAASSEGPQQGAYYIGSTVGVGVDQSFSQVVPASLWLPAGVWNP